MIGILFGSVVAKKNLTCSGGSSSVFSRALKAPGGEHVHFVDVVDLEPGPARPQAGVLPELADRLDAVVAGAVDLDDVDVLPDGDRLADVANVAGLSVGPCTQFRHLAKIRAIDVLPTPRVPLEQVSVRDAVHPDRVAERLDDVVLTDDVLEPLGPVAAGDDGIAAVGASGAAGGVATVSAGPRARAPSTSRRGRAPVGQRRQQPAPDAAAGGGESRGGSPGHMKAMLMAAAFPP